MESELENLRLELASGMSQTDLIALMRSRGFSIIDAIKATRELFNVSLRDAKQIVASHPAFGEIASASVPLQEEIVRAFEDTVTENRDSTSMGNRGRDSTSMGNRGRDGEKP